MVDISNGRSLPIFPTKNVFKSLFFLLSSPPDSISRKKFRGELTFYWGVSCATIKATYADCGGIRGGLLLLLSSEFNSPDGGGGKKGFPVCLEYLNRLFFHRNYVLLRRLAVPPSLVLFYPTPDIAV